MTQPRMPGLRPRTSQGSIFQLLQLIDTLEELKQRSEQEKQQESLLRQSMSQLGLGSLADAPTPRTPTPVPTPPARLVPSLSLIHI